jgi:hypothetical protein
VGKLGSDLGLRAVGEAGRCDHFRRQLDVYLSPWRTIRVRSPTTAMFPPASTGAPTGVGRGSRRRVVGSTIGPSSMRY